MFFKKILKLIIVSLLLFSAVGSSNDDPLFGPEFQNIDDKGYILWGARWKWSKIPVCWENPENSKKSDLDDIRKYIANSWGKNSCLSFTGWKKCGVNNLGVRIKISDEKNNGPHVKYLGNKINAKKNGMVLNLTYKKWGQDCSKSETARKLCNKSIAVHEFGHVLGFAHEHNRPDTPGECAELPQGTDGDKLLTKWDRDSVMNYCNPVYANDGKLSGADIFSVREAYCPPGGKIKD